MFDTTLAVDINGGDFDATVILEGVLDAVMCPERPLSVFICGDESVILSELRKFSALDLLDDGRLIIEHCSDIIMPNEPPSQVWRRKKNASIVRCIALQQEGKVQGSLSAGNTAVLISTAMFILGRKKGISRPALAALLPTENGHDTLLLDIGANLNCKARHLADFADMACHYLKNFFNRSDPTIRLLNVGKELGKGTAVIKETSALLEKEQNGYCGFAEGYDVLGGLSDVIVCDGFIGNVLLKTCESLHILARSTLGQESDLFTALKSRMTILNAENYGAAPLLGTCGTVLKAHGGSSPRAVTHALKTAQKVLACNATLVK